MHQCRVCGQAGVESVSASDDHIVVEASIEAARHIGEQAIVQIGYIAAVLVDRIGRHAGCVARTEPSRRKPPAPAEEMAHTELALQIEGSLGSHHRDCLRDAEALGRNADLLHQLLGDAVAAVEELRTDRGAIALELDVECSSAGAVRRFDDLDVVAGLARPPSATESAVARTDYE